MYLQCCLAEASILLNPEDSPFATLHGSTLLHLTA